MIRIGASLLALSVLALPVAAQDAAPAAAPAGEAPMDEDAAFDDAVRQFGYSGGLAWQCSAEADRPAIEEKALNAYHGIVRLFGTDQAFFFSAAFGAGTTGELKKEECEGHIASFTEQLAQAQKAE